MRRIDLRRTHAAHASNIRDINRRIVLNYVRDRGPISRAEIARQTAFQRSTVSDIVDLLITEGLIEEIGIGQSTGGRCPTLLKLHTEPGIFGHFSHIRDKKRQCLLSSHIGGS